MAAKEAADLKGVRDELVAKRRRVAIDPRNAVEGKARIIAELQQQIREIDDAIADENRDWGNDAAL